MIRFEYVDVYNFHNANRGMRNSFESWDAIDSDYHDDTWRYGPNDYSLALRLAKAGSSHRKFLRQILVSVDITAGSEYWRHFDTYKVGTVANSTSAMHTLGKRLTTEDDYSFDKPLSERAKRTIEDFNGYITDWWESGKKVGNRQWRDTVKAMPTAYMYTRTVTLNYEVLRSMYNDRKGHRLSEWKEFCRWVEGLPYSELITTTK